MPGLESIILGEKTAVIFDIGTVYTKCGFAGECGPRFILPTALTLPTGVNQSFTSLQTAVAKREFLIKFFHRLYYKHLLVNPKDRRVVLIESILDTKQSRQLFADVLYKHYEVPSVLFAPSHLLSLFTLGLSTALVLDCGYKEAIVVTVAEGFTLLKSWQVGPLGSKYIFRTLSDLLKEHALIVDENGDSLPLKNFASIDELFTPEILEDLIVRTSFVSPAARAKQWFEWMDSAHRVQDESVPVVEQPKLCEEFFMYPLNQFGGSKYLKIPSMLREHSVEGLFTGDNDNITLATLILRSIQSCPIDLRKFMAQNIVLIGGTINIPGLNARLVEELNNCLEFEEFVDLIPLKNTFRLHKPPAEPNYVAWLGGAIFGSLECLPGRSLERSVYLEKGELPDWTTVIDTDPYETSGRVDATRQ